MYDNILQKAKTALESLDPDKITSCYGDDFLFEDTTLKKQITNRDELTGYFKQLFSMSGVRFSEIRIFQNGGLAAMEWVWSGIKNAKGEKYRVKGASIIELSTDGIKRESVYYDIRDALP